MIDKEYPLYPNLTEAATKEVQVIMDKFKVKMLEVCEDALSELYTDVSMYVESDHWQNYRNQIMAGFKNYDNRKIQAEHDFAKIRKEIYKEFREQLIPDMNKDLLEEIDRLKKQIDWLKKTRH